MEWTYILLALNILLELQHFGIHITRYKLLLISSSIIIPLRSSSRNGIFELAYLWAFDTRMRTDWD